MTDEQPTAVSAQSQGGGTSLEIMANNSQNVVPSGPVVAPADATKTKRITKEAKDALIKFFEDSKWPRNKKMPKANGDSGLDKIINDFGLKRSQASNQLAKWKKAAYEKAQVQILIESTDVIKEAIEESMSETPEDFVANFLDIIIDAKVIEGCTDTTNLVYSLRLQPRYEIKLQALKYIRDNRSHGCFQSLVHYLNEVDVDLVIALFRLAKPLTNGVVVSWPGANDVVDSI